MALIKCQECGKMISEEAGACPQCGKPVVIPPPEEPAPEPEKKGGGGLIIFLLLLIIAGGGGFYFWQTRSEETKQKAKDTLQAKAEALAAEAKVEVELYNQLLTLKEDEFLHVPVNAAGPSTISIEFAVIKGVPIEIVTLNEENYKKWLKKDYKNIVPIAKLTGAEDAGVLTSSVPSGSYYVIAENTNFGNIHPPTNLKTDVTEVSLIIKMKEE